MAERTRRNPQQQRRFCRLCLDKTTTLYFSLLDKEASQMLFSLTTIKVECGAPNSTLMCIKCQINLKMAYDVQQYMIQADKKLKASAVQPAIVDEDVTSVDDDDSDPLPIELCSISLDRSNCDEDKTRPLEIDPNQVNGNTSETLMEPEEPPRTRIKYNDTSPENTICKVCARTFPTRRKLKAHEWSHLKCQKTECPICHKMIVSGYIKAHVNFHNGIGHVCEFCGKLFPSGYYMKLHIETVHQGIMPTCEQCGKTFKRKSYRDAHIRRDHSGEPLDVCSLCGKKFYNSGALKIHMDTTHLNLKMCKCEYCGKEFKRVKTLKMHVRIHTNERPYKCNICGLGFFQNVSLKGHKKSKHNIVESEDFKCQVCGKGYASDWALQTHARIHTT